MLCYVYGRAFFVYTYGREAYMTELEKIKRAKMYMDKLANGINL